MIFFVSATIVSEMRQRGQEKMSRTYVV